MNSPLPNQSTQAIAVFAACFAKTMGEKDPEFINSFQKNLEEMYYQMRDNMSKNMLTFIKRSTALVTRILN